MIHRVSHPIKAMVFIRAFFLFCIVASIPSCLYAQDFTTDWREITLQLDSGKTQTAEQLIKSLKLKAIQQHNSPQILKAIIHLAALSSNGQDPNGKESLLAIANELSIQHNEADKAVLSTVMAELLWKYYESDAEEIQERPQYKPEKLDFSIQTMQLWDAGYFRKALQYYTNEVVQKTDLLKIATRTYIDILNVHSDTEYLRPTLYDILAFKLISIWEQVERNQLRSDKAEFTDLNCIGSKAEFLRLNIQDIKGNNLIESPLLTITDIYQHILLFHANDSDQTASTDADIHRLLSMYARLFNPDADSIIIARLLALGNETAANNATPQALVEAALLYKNRDKLEKTMAICINVQKKFPQTIAAVRCKDLQNMILDKSISIETESTILPLKSFMFNVAYANIERIFCKIIRYEDCKITSNRSRRYRNYYFDKNNLEIILKAPTFMTWKQELPKSSDYTVHTVRKKGPRLPLGQYLMLTSPSPVFDIKGNNAIAYSYLQVSNIATITNNNKDGSIYVHTVHADNGSPIKDAKVVLLTNTYNRNEEDYIDAALDTLISDKDGLVIIKPSQKPMNASQLSLRIINDKDTLNIRNEVYSSTIQFIEKEQKIHFITDRILYRPGQTVHFKGIFYEKNSEIPQSIVLTNRKVSITATDMQSTSLYQKECTTGDFGSFEGQFIIPNKILPGIITINSPYGSTAVQVAEYKRPTFEVLLSQPINKVTIGGMVQVSGNISTYSGIPLSGAIVHYRVYRATTYPCWWWYWIPRPQTQDKDIAHGKVQSSFDGSFTISFTALPESGYDPTLAPVYSYRIVADATEPGGETQSQELTTYIGVLRAQYSLNHPALMPSNKPATIIVKAITHNGNPANGLKGKLIVEKLISPKQPYQRSILGPAEPNGISELDYRMQFPYEAYADQDIILKWKKDTILSESLIITDSNGIVSAIFSTLKPGAYRLIYQALDESVPFEISSSFTVYNPSSSAMPIAITELFDAGITQLEPGDTASIVFGSAWEQSQVLVQLEYRGFIVKQYWDILDNALKVYSFPVKPEYRGGFTIHCSMVRNQQLFTKTIEIQVPWTNKQLHIVASAFRKTTLPGSKEQWTFSITDNQQQLVKNAEIIALIYDASLDQISKPVPLQFDQLWDIYSSFSQMSILTSGSQFSSLYTADTWNHRDQEISMVQEYDDLSLDILLNGPFGRTEIFYMNDMAQTGSPRGQGSVFRGRNIPMVMKSSSADQIQNALDIEEKDIQAVRKDKQETALFAPMLYPSADGTVKVSCTMPESLTKWNIRLLAHSKDLKSGIYEGSFTTSKPLSINGNIPRFVYAGDTLTLRATIHAINAEHIINGNAVLDIFTESNDSLPINSITTSFSVKKDSSIAVYWTFPIPKAQTLRIRTIAKTADFTDGEESIIPILSPRITITDSYPIWLNPAKGIRVKTFEMPALNNKDILSQYPDISILTSNSPQWYAAESLPDLMLHSDNSIMDDMHQWFASKLAKGFILNNPIFKKELEKGTLKGRLTQAQELRLKRGNTDDLHPWHQDIQKEIVKDNNLMLYTKSDEISIIEQYAYKEIIRKQSPTGGFSWFELMPENRHITNEIIKSIGRIKQLGFLGAMNPELKQMLEKALRYMDSQYEKDYSTYLRYMHPKDTFHLSIVDIEYAYSRSFFKDIIPMPKGGAYDTLILLLWKDRLKNGIRAEAMSALALQRMGEKSKAQSMMNALSERSIQDEDGYHWSVKGWRWTDASIETHVLLLDAFNEISPNNTIKDGILTYLLRQKLTRNWKTSIASAEACYSILSNAEQCMNSHQNELSVMIGKQLLQGTAESFPGNILYTLPMPPVSVKNPIITISTKGQCVAWGGIYRTYESDLEDIHGNDTMPLRISTEFLRRSDDGKQEQLKRVLSTDTIYIGDKITVRITINNMRFLDYVHIKDLRASGFELIDQTAGYGYKHGMAFYQVPRDASMNFFIEYLPKGISTLEYTLRASREGIFNQGISTIESYYAPEYNGHSTGKKIRIHPIKY